MKSLLTLLQTHVIGKNGQVLHVGDECFCDTNLVYKYKIISIDGNCLEINPCKTLVDNEWVASTLSSTHLNNNPNTFWK